jgi:hypothetical protein
LGWLENPGPVRGCTPRAAAPSFAPTAASSAAFSHLQPPAGRQPIGLDAHNFNAFVGQSALPVAQFVALAA